MPGGRGSAADGGFAAKQRFPEIAQTTRCRHQTHHRRWPSNPNGRSKFRNLFVYVSKIATNAPVAAPWLTEIVQTACCRRWKHRRWWSGYQNRSKFRNYENLCLRDQSKPLEKHLFLLLDRRYYDGIMHVFFPTITRIGFCSHLWQIISRWPWPHRKTEIYILKFFFVDSI